jgi:hypothetical protein
MNEATDVSPRTQVRDALASIVRVRAARLVTAIAIDARSPFGIETAELAKLIGFVALS